MRIRGDSGPKRVASWSVVRWGDAGREGRIQAHFDVSGLHSDVYPLIHIPQRDSAADGGKFEDIIPQPKHRLPP